MIYMSVYILFLVDKRPRVNFFFCSQQENLFCSQQKKFVLFGTRKSLLFKTKQFLLFATRQSLLSETKEFLLFKTRESLLFETKKSTCHFLVNSADRPGICANRNQIRTNLGTIGWIRRKVACDFRFRILAQKSRGWLRFRRFFDEIDRNDPI